jgi:hypothetical protein
MERPADERSSPLASGLLGFAWGVGRREDPASTSTPDTLSPGDLPIPAPEAHPPEACRLRASPVMK